MQAARHPAYRAALIEAAIYLNTAITAYDVHREIDRFGPGDGAGVRVVHGVFDLVQQRVRALPPTPDEEPSPIPIFADVPDSPDAFAAVGLAIARAVAARRLQTPPGESYP